MILFIAVARLSWESAAIESPHHCAVVAGQGADLTDLHKTELGGDQTSLCCIGSHSSALGAL